MENILLKDVISSGEKKDILISGDKIVKIGDIPAYPPAKILDCKGEKAILPAFYNHHTHMAMSLMRGASDDYELFRWLNEVIWPAEKKLDREAVYWGTRLAILEMIHSGCVYFNDMYWCQMGAVKAIDDSGVRGCLGLLNLSHGGANDPRLDNDLLLGMCGELGEMISLSLAPHAVYTVSEEELKVLGEVSRKRELPIHIHASETAREVEECRKAHKGLTPIAYLDELGLLHEKTFLAHAIHLTDEDFEIVSKRRCILVHMPVSNMKLASGAFRMDKALEYSCRIALGTDGASSNNNLSMLEEMKFASLLAKHTSGNPELLKAEEIFSIATRNGAEFAGVNGGVIAEGKKADCFLVNLKNPLLSPGHNLISDLVYSADTSCIDTLFCNGKILMENGVIPGEEEVLEEAGKVAARLWKD